MSGMAGLLALAAALFALGGSRAFSRWMPPDGRRSAGPCPTRVGRARAPGGRSSLGPPRIRDERPVISCQNSGSEPGDGVNRAKLLP